MRIVDASYTIESKIDGERILRNIERYGRTCYLSTAKDDTLEGVKRFVKMLIDRGHESVLEHEHMTVRFVVDRGVSHELVRHRIASYSQESTRYCNYSGDKFGGEITVISPFGEESPHYGVWVNAMIEAEKSYFELLKNGAKPEMARAVLPNSLKTEIVMTCNMREWRHVLALRAGKAAHPQIRSIMLSLQKELRKLIPIIFD